MATLRTIDDLDVRGERVLVREDLNVPFKEGAIADTTRIVAALPTLRRLSERRARVIILSHLGRPDGKRVEKLSLAPVAAELAKQLGMPVAFADDCIGPGVNAKVAALGDGDILLLENVRFHPEEEANDRAFAQRLAALGEMYVNDAFGTAHRAHASTEGIAHLLPAAAGLLMEKELTFLSKLMHDPQRPYVCAIGGAKVHDKVGVFEALMTRVDAFVIGGGMANTFLAAQGIDVGASLRDKDLAPAQKILQIARQADVRLHLPTDAVVSPAFDADADVQTVSINAVGTRMILDIGPATAKTYAAVLEQAHTIVFNGPMGVYEKAAYQNGTRAVGEAMARATAAGATTVVGGGDAAAAAAELGFAEHVSHVSTGGGATLEYLEGKTLPGVAVLQTKVAR